MKKLLFTLILIITVSFSATLFSTNSYAASSKTAVTAESSDVITVVTVIENGTRYICIYVGDVLCSKIEDL